jgi:hypothetical protein
VNSRFALLLIGSDYAFVWTGVFPVLDAVRTLPSSARASRFSWMGAFGMDAPSMGRGRRQTPSGGGRKSRRIGVGTLTRIELFAVAAGPSCVCGRIKNPQLYHAI